MRTVKKSRQQNPLPFLAFLGILLFSFIVFVVQSQQTQSYVSRAAGGPYPTSSSCHFPCAAPACSDGVKGPSFCGDGGTAGCNVQQDDWCRKNGHGGQKPCYELGTCNSGGGSTTTGSASPTTAVAATVTPTDEEWCCNGACADAQTKDAFNATWCEGKEQWLYERGKAVGECGGKYKSSGTEFSRTRVAGTRCPGETGFGTAAAGGSGQPTGTTTPSITPVPTGIPNTPSWFNQLPTNIKNYLELLYLWVVVYRRPTNQQHLLEGLTPTETQSPTQPAALPSTPTNTPQLTPTIPPANQPGCTQKYSVVNGQCVPDNASTMCLEVCQLLIPLPLSQ